VIAFSAIVGRDFFGSLVGLIFPLIGLQAHAFYGLAPIPQIRKTSPGCSMSIWRDGPNSPGLWRNHPPIYWGRCLCHIRSPRLKR
jgi:hypothetical protein